MRAIRRLLHCKQIDAIIVTESELEDNAMKHTVTVQQPCIKADAKTACGECQASCQSACKTSCTVANQKCAKQEK